MLMKKIKLLLVCLMVAVSAVAFAQNRTVKGQVTSADDGLPIIGASVFVQGTSIGTITDSEGYYTLRNVPASAVNLVVSYIGMKDMNKPVNDVVDFVMGSDTEQLNEVVVTALGIKRSEKALGFAATAVKGDELAKARTADIMSGIQGKVAGVSISSTSSDPGASQSVIIRGVSSLSGSNRASLTVPVTKGRVGMRFRCVVRDSSGAEVTSNAATLTSGDSPAGSLAITTQPTDQSCELNESAVFTIAATGSGLTYQWQYQASGETDWSDSTLTGAKTASLTVRLTRSRMGMKFRCVVTDSTGASVTSEAATLNGTARYEIDGVIYELSNGIMSAVDYIGSADAITVQQTVAGYTVTVLGESAFENKTTLRTVTLPGTITEIGEAVFAGCTNLESVQWQ